MVRTVVCAAVTKFHAAAIALALSTGFEGGLVTLPHTDARRRNANVNRSSRSASPRLVIATAVAVLGTEAVALARQGGVVSSLGALSVDAMASHFSANTCVSNLNAHIRQRD